MSDENTPPRAWRITDVNDDLDEEYGAMIATLRGFMDDIAAARPDAATLGHLTAELGAWSQTLRQTAVGERAQVFARRPNLPDRGQSLTPSFVLTRRDERSLHGKARFGRYFLGGGGAAHGGTVPLLFDEVLGWLANARAGPVARTAYLRVDFRSITPVGVDLDLHAWIERQEGRKRLLRAQLRDDEVVCAEAEALFVTLRPGQP